MLICACVLAGFCTDTCLPVSYAGRVAQENVAIMRICVIANPSAGGGRVRRMGPALREQIARCLPGAEVLETSAAGEAAALARQSVLEGVGRLVALGGDGTTNEILNGIMREGKALNPALELGIVSCGTGCDMARGLGWPEDPMQQIERLATASAIPSDVGQVTWMRTGSACGVSYFLNTASFGISGWVNRTMRTAGAFRLLGGKMAYFHTVLKTLARHGAQRVRLTIDDGEPVEHVLLIGAACIGPYFGGGIRIAPGALRDDARLDFVSIRHASLGRIMRHIGKIYSGRHFELPEVTLHSARVILAEPAVAEEDIPIECDGECCGSLPVRIEVLPGALRLLQ